MPEPTRFAAVVGMHVSAGPIVTGSLTVAAATVLGAWLALRWKGRHEVWLGAAAGALLVIVGLHLLPDAWAASRAARLWPLAVPAACIASFAATGLVARKACACGSQRDQLGGAGGAAALVLHRFLEGAALALTNSLVVAAALAVHALAEGVAVGALLASQFRRRLTGWLGVMCLSPIAGVAAVSSFPLPPAAEPLLLALAAGVLAQVARISLGGAFRARAGWRAAPRAIATLLAAATVTALAVGFTG